MLGIELDDARAYAVGLDDQGKVLARAQVDAAGDLAGAAMKALEQVHGSMAGAPPALLGVAAINPESPTIAPVVAHLAVKFGGSLNRNGAVLSGTAAAAAEAWVGAARGVKDVVLFAVNQHATGGVVRDGAALTGARGRAGSLAGTSSS